MSSSCRNIATRGIRDGRTAIQHSNWRQFVHGNNLYDAIVIGGGPAGSTLRPLLERIAADRKSTRLNSSHGYISYAVFCLKKKKKNIRTEQAYNVQHTAGLPS